ncbi:MAG TPA: zinc ribbon domain-containing protein [Candidatus Margulisiibacteriota bacterium]|nr:zinc ribbon domain-containing protein [Candidatus Margulisiibacteriota bacterium]
MDLIIGFVFIVAAAAFVAAPFIKRETAAEIVVAAPRGQLERQKLDAYAAIKEAEFDYRMGKLSDVDFNALREKYSAQALQAIAALESAHAAQHKKLAEVRRPTRIAFCPTCGRGVPPRANFCPACGHSLKEAVA